MHYILSPIYFVLHVWAENVGEVDPLLTIIPVVVLVVVSIILRLIFGIVLKKPAASILTTCFWWLFFTYGGIYSGVKDAVFSVYPKLEFQGGIASDLPIILLVLELGVLAVVFRLLRSRGRQESNANRAFAGINSFLNGMTTLLVVIVLGTVLPTVLKLGAIGGGQRTENLTIGDASTRNTSLPNVYHLIVDGYGRQDVLLRHLAFDNSPFVEFLEGTGFTVLDDSWANYSITQASLTSTLNLDYFDRVLLESGADSMDESSITRGFATKAIRNNRLIKYMNSIGYHYLHIGSIWEATIRNPNADLEYGCSRFNFNNEFTRALVAKSWLAPFEQVGGASIARCHLRMFSNLVDISKAHKHQPYYVFAHVVLPHYPYVFKSDCSVKAQVEMSNAFSLRKELWSDAESYLEQVRCVNFMLVQALNTIIEQDPNSWIVIHSDHGPDIPRLSGINRIAARLANFIAIRAPGGGEFKIDFHSPLGALRRILGVLTKTNLGMVERYFYIPDEESGSVNAWKEYKIEELRVAVGDSR